MLHEFEPNPNERGVNIDPSGAGTPDLANETLAPVLILRELNAQSVDTLGTNSTETSLKLPPIPSPAPVSSSEFERTATSIGKPSSNLNNPEKLGLIHSAFRSACHGFNNLAVMLSEVVFTGHKIGRIACLGCTGFGWMVPPAVYSQVPLLGLFVASGALSGAIAASSVNRSIHYNPLLIGEDGIKDQVKAQGVRRFSESLSIAGLVAGPASFWNAISPALTQGRLGLLSTLSDTNVMSEPVIQSLDYLTGRIEHLVPFLLIGALTGMKLVNQNPERFIYSMSPTAGMLSRLFGPWATFRERVENEFIDPDQGK